MDTPGEWARRWTVGPREISRPGRDVSRIIQISTSANHSTYSQRPLTLTSLPLSVNPRWSKFWPKNIDGLFSFYTRYVGSCCKVLSSNGVENPTQTTKGAKCGENVGNAREMYVYCASLMSLSSHCRTL